jgi:hypothetical protein
MGMILESPLYLHSQQLVGDALGCKRNIPLSLQELLPDLAAMLESAQSFIVQADAAPLDVSRMDIPRLILLDCGGIDDAQRREFQKRLEYQMDSNAAQNGLQSGPYCPKFLVMLSVANAPCSLPAGTSARVDWRCRVENSTVLASR